MDTYRVAYNSSTVTFDRSVQDFCYMSMPNGHKRKHLEDPLLHESVPSPQPKRRKTSSPHTPPAFWNNLSKIWLTKRALGELNRRHKVVASSAPGRLRTPITRTILAELGNRPRLENTVNFLHSCDSATLKDIKRYSMKGGPDLTRLRGVCSCSKSQRRVANVRAQYSEAVDPLHCTMSSSHSSSRVRKRVPRGQKRVSISSRPTNTSVTETENTRLSGVYDRDFQQNLIDGGVYPPAYEYPDGRIPAKPDNLREINQIMARPRSSLSPSKFSDDAHENFTRVDAHAAKEKQVSELVIPLIAGKIRDTRCIAGGIPFGNLDHLTDGNLKPGNPDIYHGARPEQLNRVVRTELSGHIVPSTQEDLPIAPNFFLAAKGPDGSAAVAKRQACYDGALGARGIHSLRSYGREQEYDSNAYTISSVYHDGTLKIFTIHPVEGLGQHKGKAVYHMNQIKGYAMTSDTETFRHGATAFRNLRDWTEAQRNGAIADANDRSANGNAHQVSSTGSATSVSFTTELSSIVAATSLVDPEARSPDSPITCAETAHDELETSSNAGTPSGRLSVEPSSRCLSAKRKRLVSEKARLKSFCSRSDLADSVAS